jgi:hypothetical protein
VITNQVFIPPSAIAVALPDEQLVLCHEVLGGAGLKVHALSLGAASADGAAADRQPLLVACERITKLLPQVVVTTTTLGEDVREMIEDRAIAVGAVLVELNPDRPFDAVERSLGDAVTTARQRLGRKPRTI